MFKFPKINALQLKVLTISLFAIVILALVSYAGSRIHHELQRLENTWFTYNRIVSNTEQHLNRIERHLGYGGMIHNFKNFVLRQDKALIPKIYKNLDDFENEISSYSMLEITAEEKAALDKINKTVHLYRGKFELAQHLLEQSTLTAEKLDKAVKVNDIPAIAAFNILLEANAKRRGQMEQKTDEKLETTEMWLMRSVISIPLIVIFTGILIANIRKLSKANIEIEQAREYLNQQLEAAPDAMLSVDAKGCISKVNQQALDLFGYLREELIGQNLEILVPQRFVSQHRMYRLAFFEHSRLRSMGEGRELMAVHKDGYEFAVEINLGYLEQQDEKFAIATIRNIESRKKAEKALKKSESNLKNTLDSLPIAIAITDKEHRKFLYFNDMFTEKFGYTLEELPLIDDWWQEVTEDEKSFEKYRQSWISNLSSGGEPLLKKELTCGIHTRNGQKTINFKLVPLEGQDLIAMVDLTVQLKTQKSILAAKQEAEAANQAKSEFLANMSHEIRTPMNAINGMCYLALNTELTPEQQDFLKKIQAASSSLLSVINDILDFSKIEAGQLEIEEIPFNLSDVLDNLANISAINVEHKDVEVLYDIPPNLPHELIGDPLRLGQILINLTNNAIKFTSKGEVIIRIHTTKRLKGRRLLFAFDIKDSGIGMSREQMNKLFRSFQQGDSSTTRQYGGTGLGLAICKQLVELMKGEISVESTQGVGSKFHFTVELEMQHEDEPQIDLDQIGSLNCLVVDDNEAARNVFKKILDSFNFQVTAVASAKEAFFELHRAGQQQEKPYDVVLMDYRMPGEDGLEAAKKIKTDSGLKVVPTVIMITAHDRNYIRHNSEGELLDGLLVKPISASTMLNSILLACGHELAVTGVGTENPALRAAHHYAGINILLVEDNPTNQQVAQSILEAVGANIELAGNGVEAIQKLAENQPYDLILMDVQMPEMDGYKATEFIRANYYSYREVPILAMTANAMKGDREKCLNSGMNDHIPKPIDVAILFQTLDKWLKLDAEVPESDRLPAEDNFPQNLEGIDVKSGLFRLAGNRKLFKRVICGFYDDHKRIIENLKLAIAKKDWEKASQNAHQLKGAAGNISATKLSRIAKKLEKQIRQGDYALVPLEMAQLIDSFREIGMAVQTLEQWNDGNSLSSGQAIEYLELEQQLELLASRLKQHDLQAETLFADCREHLQALVDDEILQALETAVNSLDYEQAGLYLEESVFPALTQSNP